VTLRKAGTPRTPAPPWGTLQAEYCEPARPDHLQRESRATSRRDEALRVAQMGLFLFLLFRAVVGCELSTFRSLGRLSHPPALFALVIFRIGSWVYAPGRPGPPSSYLYFPSRWDDRRATTLAWMVLKTPPFPSHSWHRHLHHRV
jgi:hypothetical protein